MLYIHFVKADCMDRKSLSDPRNLNTKRRSHEIPHYLHGTAKCTCIFPKWMNIQASTMKPDMLANEISLLFNIVVYLFQPSMADDPPSSSSENLTYQSWVARCYIFQPKILIWVNFGGSWNVKGWYVQLPFGIYYGHLVHFICIC
jgi:hypothetical protein